MNTVIIFINIPTAEAEYAAKEAKAQTSTNDVLPGNESEVVEDTTNIAYMKMPMELNARTSAETRLSITRKSSEIADLEDTLSFTFDGNRNVQSELCTPVEVLHTYRRYENPNNEDRTQYLGSPFQTGLPNPDVKSMEAVCREILEEHEVLCAIWVKNADETKYEINFTVVYDETFEHVMKALQSWGIGIRPGSSLSVLKCIATKHHLGNAEVAATKNSSVWQRFMNNVRCRLNVVQVIIDVRREVVITTEFLILLVSASLLAAFGLVENDCSLLISSMLISPLMCPIMGSIFGTVIHDRSLGLLGLRNELIGILLATFIGFLAGISMFVVEEVFGIGARMSTEMFARCELHSLMVSALAAIPSGASAAISILSGNVIALIGVAISASLLPPAVNSGFLMALACICKYFEIYNQARYQTVITTYSYKRDPAMHLVLMAMISMLLTLSNVLCLYVLGVVVLRIKEITPSLHRSSRILWKHDIQLARDICSHNKLDADDAILDEYARLSEDDKFQMQHNYEVMHRLHMNDLDALHTWSPIKTARGLSDESIALQNIVWENYWTVHCLDLMYNTMVHQHLGKTKSTVANNDMAAPFAIRIFSGNNSARRRNISSSNSLVLTTDSSSSLTSCSAAVPTPRFECAVECSGSADDSRRGRFTVTPVDDSKRKHISDV